MSHENQKNLWLSHKMQFCVTWNTEIMVPNTILLNSQTTQINFYETLYVGIILLDDYNSTLRNTVWFCCQGNCRSSKWIIINWQTFFLMKKVSVYKYRAKGMKQLSTKETNGYVYRTLTKNNCIHMEEIVLIEEISVIISSADQISALLEIWIV